MSEASTNHYPIVLMYEGCTAINITAAEGRILDAYAKNLGVTVFDLTDYDVDTILSAAVAPQDASSLEESA